MIKAIIFDMDGVISDTEVLQETVEASFLEKEGIFLTPEQISKRFAGCTSEEMFETLFKEYEIPSSEIPHVLKDKWMKTFQVARKNLRPIPGSIELIEKCRQSGLKLGVASSSTAAFVNFVLTHLQVRKNFEQVVSADEVIHGKPSPDIFLLCAKKLGVKPFECVVIEDAVNGMLAAKKAGMNCIGLVKHGGKYPADLTVTSLKQLNVEKIIALGK